MKQKKKGIGFYFIFFRQALKKILKDMSKGTAQPNLSLIINRR